MDLCLHFNETWTSLEPFYVLKSLSCWTSQLASSSSWLPPFVWTSSREGGHDSQFTMRFLLVYSACRKTVRLRSIKILSCAAGEMCAHVFTSFLPCSSLIRQSCSLLSVSILGFPQPTFLLILIPIPWSSPPARHLTSPAELRFILRWSNQLHQTLPVSSITARHSPSTNLLFPHLLLPLTSSLHCHCLTSKAPVLTQVPPPSHWYPAEEPHNPTIIWHGWLHHDAQVRRRPGWGGIAWAVLSWIFFCQVLQLYENLCEQCVWSELHKKEANRNCFCLGLQNRIHE